MLGLKYLENALHAQLGKECDLSRGVIEAASKAGAFGIAGAYVGVKANAFVANQATSNFERASLSDRNFSTTNAIHGPYFPEGHIDWRKGGSAIGNFLSNLVTNLNQF